MMASPKNGVSEIERNLTIFNKGGRFVLLSEPSQTLQFHTTNACADRSALDIRG